MKRKTACISLLLVIPLLIAMGPLGGQGSPDKIPVPEKKFFATFIDQDDVVTECRDTSIEGGTFLEGKRGAGTYAISFENISHVLFYMNGGKLQGVVKLNDGSVVELALNKDSKAYGRTKFGTFQIRLADLKKIIVGGSASHKGN